LPKKSSSMGMRSACARSHRTHAALCCTTARGCSRALALELWSAALCRDFFTGGVGAGVTRNRGGVAIVTCSRMCVSGNSRATVSGWRCGLTLVSQMAIETQSENLFVEPIKRRSLLARFCHVLLLSHQSNTLFGSQFQMNRFILQ
jgi:hypothetical protein